MKADGAVTNKLRIAQVVEDTSSVGACPDCGAWLIRTHFEPDQYRFEHWVERCLSCGYGREFKLKDGKVEEWFQHPLTGPPSRRKTQDD